MPSASTVYDLEKLSDYFGFEAFCSDLLAREGFPGITPLGGIKDKGRDAIHHDPISNTIFAYSARKDWRKKLQDDLTKIRDHNHPCQCVVFATTADISATEFDALRSEVAENYDWALEIYDIKRIATLVDNNHPDLISRHPGIFALSNQVGSIGAPFEPVKYCKQLLDEHAQSPDEYTLLMAEHREIDTYVSRSTKRGVERLAVVDVPKHNNVAFVLGESGAGKSTSLWQLVAEYGGKVVNGSNTQVPALIRLRHWSMTQRCEHLLFDQFKVRGFDENTLADPLDRGEFLIVLDGLNELVRDRARDCYEDLKLFMHRYSSNQFVVACRSVDFETVSQVLRGEPPRITPVAYEIVRMERRQIRDYSADYLARYDLDATEFFDALEFDDDELWVDASSILQLLGIPLFLQVFLDTFRHSGELPNSRVDLLRELVVHVVRREIERGSPFDRSSYERFLGGLAKSASIHGYNQQFPNGLALEWLGALFPELRSSGVVGPSILLSELWQRILSGNFLFEDRYQEVSWLHQLIRDYFLGAEYAREWLRNESAREPTAQQLASVGFETVLAVTLSLLPVDLGATLIRSLVVGTIGASRRAFEGQSTLMRRQLSDALVLPILADGDWETKELNRLAEALPFVEFVEALDAAFYDAPNPGMQAKIVEALAEFMISHQPRVASDIDRPFIRPGDQVRQAFLVRGVRRCGELLRRYIRNRGDAVSFQAARGMFETDRGAAVDRLRELLAEGDPETQTLVRDLADEWGLL